MNVGMAEYESHRLVRQRPPRAERLLQPGRALLSRWYSASGKKGVFNVCGLGGLPAKAPPASTRIARTPMSAAAQSAMILP